MLPHCFIWRDEGIKRIEKIAKEGKRKAVQELKDRGIHRGNSVKNALRHLRVFVSDEKSS